MLNIGSKIRRTKKIINVGKISVKDAILTVQFK